MNEDYYLDFEIRSTQFLGLQDVAHEIIIALSKLPKKFNPTKCVGADFKKKPFSFKSPGNFITMVPGAYAYKGHATIYKVKNIFELTVFWAKGNEDWFVSNPGQRFNTIVFSFFEAEKVISDQDVFSSILIIWLELCDKLSAAFGYCYVNQHFGTKPRGEGYCLPRLHWLTYFGNEYSREFELNSSTKLKGANLEYRDNDTTLISIDKSPFDLVDQNENEWNLIEQLGFECFWGYTKDDWRKPKAKYRMPEFSWDTILLKD